MQSVEHESCQAFEDGQLTEIKGVLSGGGALDGRGSSGMPNLAAMGVRKTEWTGAERRSNAGGCEGHHRQRRMPSASLTSNRGRRLADDEQ